MTDYLSLLMNDPNDHRRLAARMVYPSWVYYLCRIAGGAGLDWATLLRAARQYWRELFL